MVMTSTWIFNMVTKELSQVTGFKKLEGGTKKSGKNYKTCKFSRSAEKNKNQFNDRKKKLF